MTKLANWDTTIALFTDEYQGAAAARPTGGLPGGSVELITPVLLVLGLFTDLRRSSFSA